MKTQILLILALSVSVQAFTNTKVQEYKFVFKANINSNFEVKKQATTKEAAFKLAAHECYQHLTAGMYPGEERGLDIIDICANPKM